MYYAYTYVFSCVCVYFKQLIKNHFIANTYGVHISSVGIVEIQVIEILHLKYNYSNADCYRLLRKHLQIWKLEDCVR